MEKLTTVDLLLIIPLLKHLSKGPGNLAPLFADLYKKLDSELKSRPLAVVEEAVKTIVSYEPNAIKFSEDLLAMLRVGQLIGAKTMNDHE